MKRCLTKTAVVAPIAFAMFSLALPLPAHASVYDDVKAWWHLNLADSGTPGINDIRDQRYWQDPTSTAPYTATAVGGDPTWTNTGIPEFGPAGGRTYGGRALQFDGDGDAFEVSDLAITGDATVVLRYRWDGAGSGSGDSAILYSNGFNWGTNEGWLLRLYNTNGRPNLYYGNGSVTANPSGWTSDPGKWYDLAMVIDENGANSSVSFYRVREYTDLTSAPGDIQQTTYTGFDLAGGEADATLGTIVGQESAGKNSYNGLLDHVAVWDRALSPEEVRHAFGSPQPQFSLGIDNSTNYDLIAEGAWSTSGDYTLGEPWHNMWRAVTASKPVANVNFDLTADEAALRYMAHVDMQGAGSGGGTIDVSINGHVLGTHTVTGAGDLTWEIDPEYLVSGANTFSIQHTGGSWVSWDWLELGGAWQVGYDDNTQSEFITEGDAGDHFYVTDRQWDSAAGRWIWPHLERALTGSDPDLFIHFELSEELADLPYLYTTEVTSQSAEGTHEMTVDVNGQLLALLPHSPNSTKFELFIPASLLQAGDNYIHLVKQNPTGYTQFDFHRLELFNVPEPGTCGLALLAVFALAASRRRWDRR